MNSWRGPSLPSKELGNINGGRLAALKVDSLEGIYGGRGDLGAVPSPLAITDWGGRGGNLFPFAVGLTDFVGFNGGNFGGLTELTSANDGVAAFNPAVPFIRSLITSDSECGIFLYTCDGNSLILSNF